MWYFVPHVRFWDSPLCFWHHFGYVSNASELGSISTDVICCVWQEIPVITHHVSMLFSGALLMSGKTDLEARYIIVCCFKSSFWRTITQPCWSKITAVRGTDPFCPLISVYWQSSKNVIFCPPRPGHGTLAYAFDTILGTFLMTYPTASWVRYQLMSSAVSGKKFQQLRIRFQCSSFGHLCSWLVKQISMHDTSLSAALNRLSDEL